MFFVLKIRLPPGGRGTHVPINALSTDLPNYRHTAGDLARDFDFGKFSLHSSNSPITVKVGAP